jgi:hypothetical protein
LSDTPKQIRERGLRYAVVSDLSLLEQRTSLENWSRATGAELLATNQTTVKVSSGPQTWYVVRFKD